MKKNYKIIVVLISGLLLFTGCRIEVNSPQSARDDNYGVSKASQALSSSENIAEGIFEQSGAGDTVFTNLSLKKGASILSVTFSQGQHISVRVLDNDGTIVASLKKDETTYSGQQVISIPKDGDNYIVEIQSDGNWEVKIASTIPK